jgi:DNA-binding PadR family transcriptional regulator
MLPPDRNLAEMIQQLEADRRRHAEAIEAIDQVLAQVGRVVSHARLDTGDFPVPPGVSGTPPGRRRGKFELTGERSVLQFISKRSNPTTGVINELWRSEGRRGVANVILLKLLKQGLIFRMVDASIRGSRYRLTGAGEEEARNAKDRDIQAPVEPRPPADEDGPVATRAPGGSNRLS